MDNPAITLDELMEIVPAPDFPTGPLIWARAGRATAYATGRGSIMMRARHDVETGATTGRRLS